MSNLTRAEVEAWLDAHPDVCSDYFARKAELSTINAWLVTHGYQRATNVVHRDNQQSDPASFTPNFRHGLRYFSPESPPSNLITQEFRFGNNRFTTDSKTSLRQDFARARSKSTYRTHDPSTSEPSTSRRTSLRDMRRYTSLPPTTVNMLSALIESKVKLPKGFPFHSKATKINLRRVKGENEFFLSIVRDIATELDIKNLSLKTAENLSILLNCDGALLFVVETQSNGVKILVSKVNQVENSADGRERENEVKNNENGENCDIRVPWGTGILGYVAETGDIVNLRVASQDTRFNPTVDKITGFNTESLLCMPVKNAFNDILAVVLVVNKSAAVDNGYFTASDVQMLGTYLQFIGIAITNAQIMDSSRKEYERNRSLLEVVHNLFEQQTSLEKVMVKIMERAQKLLDCQKSAILLLEDTAENSSFARLFELAASSSGEGPTAEEKERAGAVSRYLVGVAEKVVSTGEVVNVREVVDTVHGHGIIIHNLLAMPIRNSRCEVIGVGNILDKCNGQPFDANDGQLFEAYTIFCGLGLHNTLMFSEVEKAVARQKVALEVLSYHTSANTKEVESLMGDPIPCADDLDLYSLSFDDFSLEPDEMVKAAVSMFLELDLVKNYSIEKNTLYRFLVSVKRNYRDVPYHNWRHAFNVSQVMFAILMGCEMKGTFSDLEVLGMFVGCLCHDLDHRGTNNAFQQKSGSALVLLYGTNNTMEHHHFNHAVMILSSESNNIFSGLSPEDYSKVMEILKHTILSTDLSVYFEKRNRFFELVKTRTYSWDLDDHRELLRSMLMTACDLAASCKPWEVQKKVAHLVTSEFFEQGDKERDELHLTPQPLMDRQRRHELPQLQIDWMTDVCLPLYESLGEMNPKLSPMSEGAAENRRQWQKIVDEKNTMNWDTTE